MLNKLPIALALFSVATFADARGLDVKLADEMAELTYLTESSTFGYGGADVGFGLLFNEADDLHFTGKLMITGNPAGNNRPFQFGVGGKLMLTSFDRGNFNEDVGALAIGAQARYVIPSATPIAFVASGYFAPGITSFSGADQYTEVNFAVELEVTPSARAYVGFRNMEYEFENGGEVELDDDLHIGIKFDF